VRRAGIDAGTTTDTARAIDDWQGRFVYVHARAPCLLSSFCPGAP
jgi:hypothetical protein